MEKYQVLGKFYAVNNQIQEYKIKKHQEFMQEEGVFTLGVRGDIEKFSSSSRKILRLLLECGNSNQRNIARHLDISSQAVSEAIKKLENTGCVVKVAGAQNNENIIQITDEGKVVAEIFKSRIEAHANMVFENMTEEELESFYELLCKMNV